MNRKDFRSFLRSMFSTSDSTHMVGGLPALDDNKIQLSFFKNAWICLASDVISRCDLNDTSTKARIEGFRFALFNYDIIDILNICIDASNLLIGISTVSYGDFKDHLMKQHPLNKSLIEHLLMPINPLLVSMFSCPDVKASSLSLILQFLRYGKKLNLESIGLEEQAITAYLECEDKLAALDVSSIGPLLSGVNQIMRCWLRELDLSNLVPSHGSGSVAEGKLSLYEKYKNLGSDIYLKVVLGPKLNDYYPVGQRTELCRVSRTVFVPKTYSKLRTISMEPVTLQYFQQGVMKKLYDFIDHHPYLGLRVKLRDQSQNQEMAKQASIDNSMSTIDLSAASDSVSWRIVKAIFYRTPLLKWMYATRSSKTKLPNGNVIALRKFAPMGSALCFPVECLIFAAVIEYVSQKWCHENKKAKRSYSVFGDDLIVAKEITPEVINALTALGFSVNKDKSFVDGPFRESCGCDYYEGIDVSSLYYRVKFTRSRVISPEVYASLCSAINLCAEKNYENLRSYLLELLLPYHPYFTDDKSKSPAVYSPCPTNYHVSRKWHADYQLWLGKFCSVISKPIQRNTEYDDVDDVAYFVKLCQMAERSNAKPLDVPSVSVNLHGSTLRLGVVRYEVDVVE